MSSIEVNDGTYAAIPHHHQGLVNNSIDLGSKYLHGFDNATWGLDCSTTIIATSQCPAAAYCSFAQPLLYLNNNSHGIAGNNTDVPNVQYGFEPLNIHNGIMHEASTTGHEEFGVRKSAYSIELNSEVLSEQFDGADRSTCRLDLEVPPTSSVEPVGFRTSDIQTTSEVVPMPTAALPLTGLNAFTANRYQVQSLAPAPIPQLSMSVPTHGPTPLVHNGTQGHRVRCHFPGCGKSFKRSSDLTRHVSTHYGVTGLYLCPIVGCSKSYGRGYSRPDKVTEHLWKKHANLGYTKA